MPRLRYIVDLAQPVNRTAPLNRGLVAWWLCLPHQNRGVLWRDLMHKNDGTLTSLTAATTHIGPKGRPGGFGCLNFVGSGRVDAGTTILVTTTLPWTVSFWAKVDSFSDNFPVIASIRNEDQTFLCFASNAGSPYDGFGFGTGSTAAFYVYGHSGTAPTLKVWYHVLFTFNGGTRTTLSDYACYINGVAVTLITFGTALGVTPVRTIFGDDNINTNTQLTGQLDDIRVWAPRWFSAVDAQQLYANSKMGYSNALNWIRRPGWGLVQETGVQSYYWPPSIFAVRP